MPEIERTLDWEELGTTQDEIGDELEPEFEEAYGERAAGVLTAYLLDQLQPYIGHDGELYVRDLDETHPYDMCDYADMDIVTFEAVRMEYTERVKELIREVADDVEVEAEGQA